MKVSYRDKLRYRFERFMSKGGSSIFLSLFVVFIVLFLLIILARYIIVWIWPDLAYTDSFADDVWFTWLQLTDPGNMNQDNLSPTWLKVTTVLSGVIGVIILSMLIAFITTTLEHLLFNFRKGRGKVIEEEHTLILGWNERVIDIIRELILANESEKYASVVVLSREEKEIMDDMIAKRLPDTKSTRIVTTSGDFANLNELARVNITGARSVILLAGCSESASFDDKMDSDIQSIKSVMAIIASQNGKNELPIIAEIFNPEKRELVGFFNDENIIALDSWDIMGKLLVQTSLTSGLEMVYNEILSFDGCEIYFHHEKWNGAKFGELAFRFPDGIPLGIYSAQGELKLRPDDDYSLKSDDEIIILAEDDSSIALQNSPVMTPRSIELSGKKMEQKQKNILILGWHNVAEIFVAESSDYLKAGSKFDILYHEPNDYLLERVANLKEEYADFEITLHQKNPMHREALEEINPFNYDNIIILSQDIQEQRADKVDSDTLIILLLLRKIKGEGGLNTKIITQVLNSENQNIITQTDVDDFIISNKLITMILAQLSEEPRIKALYDDIFSEDGSEIYVKPADLYFNSFPQKVRFGDLIALAGKREEICLGIRKGNLSKTASENFGVRLNLPKNEEVTITENDFLVVLSEDEL